MLAQQHLGQERMAALDDALERWVPGLTEQPAYPHLRGLLALRWVDGTPPQKVVEEATWYRGTQSVTEADDPAAALAWRIAGATAPSDRDAPLPWLPDIPGALRQDAETSDYLDRLTDRIDDLKQRVTDEAQQPSASDRMPWQRALPADVDDQLIADLAIWRAAHDIPSTEPSPAGTPSKEPQAVRYQTRLIHRLRTPTPVHGASAPDAAGRLRDNQRQAERQRLNERPSREAPGFSR